MEYESLFKRNGFAVAKLYDIESVEAFPRLNREEKDEMIENIILGD